MGKVYEVNTTELAEIMGLTTTQIINYWHAGMPKLARGNWDLAACWRWRYDRLAKELEAALQNSNESADRELEDALLKRTQREIKEIELEKLRGSIVETSRVGAIIERAVAAFRSRMLSIPTKSATRVIACADPNEARAILDADIHDALSELSRISTDVEALRTLAQADAPDQHASPEADGEPVGGQGKVPKRRSKRRARKVAHRPS